MYITTAKIELCRYKKKAFFSVFNHQKKKKKMDIARKLNVQAQNGYIHLSLLQTTNCLILGQMLINLTFQNV